MKKTLAAFLSIALTTSLSATASAQSLTFMIDNEYTKDVKIEFYSTERNHVWPGNGEVYVLGPSDGTMSYPLSCRTDELICFGAWTEGNRDSWGVGREMEFDCTDCCATCSGQTIEDIILN